MVLWIGFLQQHYRNHTGHPAEPILKAHGNIRRLDAVVHWDGAPEMIFEHRDGHAVQVWPNARLPDWPPAEFIIGNPPFIGGKDLRSRLDAGYAETLWKVHPQMNESADFVMYWWDRAADILTRPGSILRRFGFVTTNSITQVFQRRTVERWITGPSPLSLRYAVPDHPWTKAGKDRAAVRISMTVAEAGRHDGMLLTRVSEADLDTDEPVIELSAASGRINPDLTVGVDATTARALKASAGICSPGVKLHGSGFIVTHGQALALGLGRRPGLDRHLRPYRNGRDLMGRCRDAWILDFHGLSVDDLRRDFPEAYQHLAETVREDRRAQVEKSPTADARAYLEAWWVFGKPRPELRSGLTDLSRYIVTVETAKHRVFQFLNGAVLADNMLICVADDDAATLAILSSKVHLAWCAASGGVLEDRPRYTKSRCFDPFPFPPRDEAMRGRLREASEALDAHRRAVLADNPDLTLTTLYNCLELVRAGVALDERSEALKQRGLVIILRDLHDAIDRLTLEAYGWPAETGDADIVARLVALNQERAQEEVAGHVRWLRPAYQRSRAGMTAPQTRALILVPGEAPAQRRPRFPSDRYEQPLAVQAVLETSGPAASADLARRFSGGARLEPRISRVLTTLHRYGHVDRLPDGRWTASRAA